MNILSIVGFHNSGKTTVVKRFIEEWTQRGFTVGTIKDIHIDNFSIDSPGKDTWIHKQAGAEIVGMLTPVETNILIPRRKSLKEVLPFFQTDYLILEGFATQAPEYPRIICAKDEHLIVEHLIPSTFAISGIISDTLTSFKDLPVLNASRDWERLFKLANNYLNRG